MKKLFIIILLAFITLPANADKILVEITPIEKISTSNENLSEGDYVYFKDIKTNEKIRGLITQLEENGFAGKEAIISISQFQAIDSENQYEGAITVKGDEHKGVMRFYEFLASFVAKCIRGGEAQIRPDKDIFTIWRL